ncbi:MAG: 30S ribosomal protein S24e [Candidatus Methanoplasma sp.]|jgi:small subunit ribosomal protein S24e|nr:30S ribosomal protein S24e [Candidatus Methanoplasma sp.]
MKIEIINQKENPLQKRKEVYFTIDHAGESTPGRNAVAEDIAKKMKSKRDCVVIDNIETVYGIGKSKGYAKVYDSKESAMSYENGYLLKRNGIGVEPPAPAPGAAPPAAPAAAPAAAPRNKK